MKKTRIKILFIIPTLTTGGAERIMTFLSENFNKTIFECSLIVIGSSQHVSYETSNTKVKYLNHRRVLFSIPSLIRCFKNEKPQIVFGSIGHLNLTLGLISPLFPKIFFVGRESGINKVAQAHSNLKTNALLEFFTKVGMNKLDFIICQSTDMQKDCKESFQINEKKLKIIRNPITDQFKVKENDRAQASKSGIYRFITVGRLNSIKGHERILDILSEFTYPFTYTIIGDGPKKTDILQKIKCLGLKEQITFINFTKDVREFLSQSDFYLQGSYAEGFPNALLESCAVGTPVIAFNAPGGTREIVQEGVNGYLVNNNEEFLDRLHNLKSFNPIKVSESVKKKFAKDIILKEYETFFIQLVANAAG